MPVEKMGTRDNPWSSCPNCGLSSPPDPSSASGTKEHNLNNPVVDPVEFDRMSPWASFYVPVHARRSYSSSSRLGNLTPTHAGSARRFRPSLETPHVSQVELESVTVGTLMTNGDAIYRNPRRTPCCATSLATSSGNTRYRSRMG